MADEMAGKVKNGFGYQGAFGPDKPPVARDTDFVHQEAGGED